MIITSKIRFMLRTKQDKGSYLLAFMLLVGISIMESVIPIFAQPGGGSENPPNAASSQAQNGAPANAAPNDSLKGSLRLSAEMQIQTGNLDRFMIRGGASGELRNSSFAVMSSLSYSQQRIFGQALEDDWFGFADIQVLPNNTVFPMAFVEFETSQLRFLQLRLQGGVGAGVHIARSQAVNLSLSAAFTYDQTRFRMINSYEGWRYSFHLHGRYVLAEGKIVLTHNFFSQPTAALTSNYRHRLIAMLMIPITRNLSISSTLDYSYESVVDETRKNTNLFNAVGLTWNF